MKTATPVRQRENVTHYRLSQPLVYEQVDGHAFHTRNVAAVHTPDGVRLYPADEHGEMFYFNPVGSGKTAQQALRKAGYKRG